MTISSVGAPTNQWATSTSGDADSETGHWITIQDGSGRRVFVPDAPDLPTDPTGSDDTPPADDPQVPTSPSTPDAPDTPDDPPVPRNRFDAAVRSMRLSSGAAFADSAYFTGLFERNGDDNGLERSRHSSGVNPDWMTIGLAGGTVAGLGGLYKFGQHLATAGATKTAGVAAIEGAARAVGGIGKLALFATPVLAAGVAAPAIADLAHFAAPKTFKENREIPSGATQNQRNRIENDNDSAWFGRVAAGAVGAAALTAGALLLHKKPLPTAFAEKWFGTGLAGAARGAAAMGLVGGVSAGAFYNVFDADGNICRTHSPLRAY